jgi:hypothetical protein
MPGPTRSPKGTYIRLMDDWFYTTSVTAGVGMEMGIPNAGNFVALSLYNDTQIGWQLYLDGLDVCFPGQTLFTYHTEGVDGKIQVNGIPIYSGQGKQPGTVWVYNSTVAPPLMPQNSEWSGAYAIPATGGMFRIRGRGPIAVIKPGYSFAVVCQDADGVNPLTGTFYWSAVNG